MSFCEAVPPGLETLQPRTHPLLQETGPTKTIQERPKQDLLTLVCDARERANYTVLALPLRETPDP